MSYSTIDTPVSINALGRPQLLIVNADPLTRELYTHVLNLEGYDVETAGDGADALEWLEMEEFQMQQYYDQTLVTSHLGAWYRPSCRLSFWLSPSLTMGAGKGKISGTRQSVGQEYSFRRPR
jgi:hypothetical protein